jgi:hypothetical protein
MVHKVADDWFNAVDYVSIISTIKGIYTSDGSMSILLDFERVLDDSDLYAYKNWLLGELVQGPNLGRYDVTCIFMWPYKLMPDPRGIKRLIALGCKVEFAKSDIKVPVEITNYDDFVPGTKYPRMMQRKIWFVKITVPLDLMDDIKEGSIDIAGQTMDLADIQDAYDEDLDKQNIQGENEQQRESSLSPAGPLPAGTALATGM